MEWKEYEEKKRFRRVITNTFSSNEDCEMFIMVLKQQWPKHINKLPDIISKLADEEDKGYLLEVDVDYSKELHDEHNELPFLVEKNEN